MMGRCPIGTFMGVFIGTLAKEENICFLILFSPTYTLYLYQKGELQFGQSCPYRPSLDDNNCFADFERLASFIKNGLAP